ncbi:nuclease-related domain-containing protein [Pontibacillus marinus]|uniref:NERD domain-containing protein n=1 Tax=Pontibacillus marinus BH030004 = DSM 16465 TaxID=1385511 RepID=A0A0A5FXL2_9BACI|nr:nuclease-related domain-containing protein [Pontibacillus marinus]KGX83540.1 hypothetical protein N783_20425 [Pontibacillus marinus BH030004 = DSM 16465]
MIFIRREDRAVPIVLMQEEALLERLEEAYPKRNVLKESISSRQAGHRGEITLDYYLRFLPHKEYYIIRGVRLIIFGEPCQIDTLVLTPRAAFVIEVKNLQGELSYDENSGQFTQTTAKKGKKSIANPLLQVERHQLQFEKWLHFQKVFSYPIIPLVAISNPSTILNFPQGNPHQWKIAHSENIPTKIKQIEQNYANRNQTVDFGWLEKRLMEDHRPGYYHTLKKFGVSPTELITGVRCNNCLRYRMVRKRKRWECINCGHRSLNADAKAIADYFLLLSSSITTKECNEFLHLENRYQAIGILKRLGLEKEGASTGTIYKRPKDILNQLINKE